MRSAGIYESIANKLVLGENISQAAQFVDSGNADVGILALSLAMAPSMTPRGRYFAIDSKLYPPIEQGAVVLSSSKKKDLGKQFLAFLKRPGTQSILHKYGF